MLTRRLPMRLLRRLPQSKCVYSTNAAAELTYPESSSPHHHNLSSFLDYANRIGLNTNSTVYVGTHYEYTVQNALERMGMSLKRMGGRSDYGIDILGTWPLPSALQPLKLLVQCKALSRKIDPAQVRELEGAFAGAPTGWRGSGVLALLVAPKSATKGVREALGRSRWPMGYAMCSTDGKILQMLWNKRAEQEGLHGIQVGIRYTGGDVTEREVILTWKGKPIK